MNKMNIQIPNTIKLILWKNEKIKNSYMCCITNHNKKFNFFLKYTEIAYVDKWLNTLCVVRKNCKSLEKSNNFINLFIKSWDFYFYSKIKFKGKGFRLKFYKKINVIKFYFGKSHKTFYMLKKIKRKKINKYKFILFSINYRKIKKMSTNISNIRNINMYTLRGIRKSRQTILKRKGKKGTYI